MTDFNPSCALYGVDFSGAKERNGRNKKLCVAGWDPVSKSIRIESGGGKPGFTRSMLARRIIDSPGLHVIDFPFGPEKWMATALGLNSWEDYLDWAAAAANAKTLWEDSKDLCRGKGVNLHARRVVDNRLGTTWDPMNLRLFRQTLNGAKDVLHPLNAADRSKVRVLPWHDMGDPSSQAHVVEGFPGWTLQSLGLSKNGYKGDGESCKKARLRILHHIVKQELPISPVDIRRAAKDEEGDLVDALVLLYAAWQASMRNAAEWAKLRNRCLSNDRLIEGDFLD